MLFGNKEKSVTKFAEQLVKLDAPSVLGVARLLGVELFYPDVKDEQNMPIPRTGEAILEDCLIKFYALNREARKELLKITKKAAKEKN